MAYMGRDTFFGARFALFYYKNLILATVQRNCVKLRKFHIPFCLSPPELLCFLALLGALSIYTVS